MSVASLQPYPKFKSTYLTGTAVLPLNGGKLYTYAAGTSTPLATYTDQTAVTANANPVILNANGEADAWFLNDTAYKLTLTDAAGVSQWTVDNIQAPAGLRADMANTASAILGDYLVGVKSVLTGGTARTQHDKNADITHVKDFGAVGDGVTDDTTALQTAYASAAGRTVEHGDGLTYIVNATLPLYSGTLYRGKSIIKAKNATAIAGALMKGTSVTGVVVQDLEFHGNASSPNGANYGIWFELGTDNRAERCYIHDTLQAGIVIRGENGSKAIANRLSNCGRAGATDNHGIMIYSDTASACQNIVIAGNYVDTAYRKGITTYTATAGGGALKNVIIIGNVVVNCGVAAASGGGVYCANQAAAATPQAGICVNGNTCRGNYINIEVDNVKGGEIVGNFAGFDGGSGGIACDTISNVVISGNTITDSSVHGLNITSTGGTSTNVTVVGNTVMRSNTLLSGFGAGIYLNNTTASTCTGNTVNDDAAKMTHGIIEGGTADNNLIAGNNVRNATAANYTTVGASSTLNTQSGGNNGYGGVTAPGNIIDMNGGITRRPQTITLATGANNNVALPAKTGTLFVAGPAGVYNISGIAGGVDGREIRIINYTSFAMTINFNSASSSAGNRILIGGSADLAISAYGSVDLTYLATASAWMMTAYKA